MTKDMPKQQAAAPIDPPPDADELTNYDRANMALYLKLLDGETAGIDWAIAAQDLLQFDPVTDRDNAKRVFDSVLRRAHWMTEVGFLKLLQAKS